MFPMNLKADIARIGRIVFDRINDPNRSTANVETYCKKQECWDIISKVPYQISDELAEVLISPKEKALEAATAKKSRNSTMGYSTRLLFSIKALIIGPL